MGAHYGNEPHPVRNPTTEIGHLDVVFLCAYVDDLPRLFTWKPRFRRGITHVKRPSFSMGTVQVHMHLAIRLVRAAHTRPRYLGSSSNISLRYET